MVEEVEKLLFLFLHTIFELKDKPYLNIYLDYEWFRFIEFLNDSLITLIGKDNITIYLGLIRHKLIEYFNKLLELEYFHPLYLQIAD